MVCFKLCMCLLNVWFFEGGGVGGGGNLLMWILMFIYLCVVKIIWIRCFVGGGGVIDKYLLVYLIVVCLVGEK